MCAMDIAFMLYSTLTKRVDTLTNGMYPISWREQINFSFSSTIQKHLSLGNVLLEKINRFKFHAALQPSTYVTKTHMCFLFCYFTFCFHKNNLNLEDYGRKKESLS